MNIYELIPTNGRKSFYGKAKVVVGTDGTETLYSYNTPIIERSANGKLKALYDGNKYGTTTASHVKSFCGLTKKEYNKLLAREMEG